MWETRGQGRGRGFFCPSIRSSATTKKIFLSKTLTFGAVRAQSSPLAFQCYKIPIFTSLWVVNLYTSLRLSVACKTSFQILLHVRQVKSPWKVFSLPVYFQEVFSHLCCKTASHLFFYQPRVNATFLTSSLVAFQPPRLCASVSLEICCASRQGCLLQHKDGFCTLLC